MSNASFDNLGKLVLRLTLGVLLLAHGINKLLHGIAPITHLLANHGLPTFLAGGIYIGEVIAPVLIILGLYARLGGLLVVVNMLFALFLRHMGDFGQLTEVGGWRLEVQGFYLLTGLAVALLGAGRLSLGGSRWN
jgi:putative oxidoreductase